MKDLPFGEIEKGMNLQQELNKTSGFKNLELLGILTGNYMLKPTSCIRNAMMMKLI